MKAGYAVLGASMVFVGFTIGVLIALHPTL